MSKSSRTLGYYVVTVPNTADGDAIVYFDGDYFYNVGDLTDYTESEFSWIAPEPLDVNLLKITEILKNID